VTATSPTTGGPAAVVLGSRPAPPGQWSSIRRRLLLVAAVALALRMAYVLLLTQSRPLGPDALFYALTAENLADGRGYESGWGLAFNYGIAEPTAQFPPLLPTLLAPFAWLPGDSRLWMHLALCVVGTGTVVATALVARRLGGDRVATVAGGLAAVSPMMIGADGALMAESPYALLVVGTVLGTLRALDRPTGGRWLVVGLLVGLATMTRSDGLALVLAVALPATLLVSGSLRRRLRSTVMILTGVALVVGPWTVRNVVRLDEPVWLSNNSGTVMAGANCTPSYFGSDSGSWNGSCLSVPRSHLDETGYATWARSKGVRYAQRHWKRLVAVVPLRAARTWGLWHPVEQVRRETSEGRVYGVQLAGWATTLVLAGLAAPAAWRLRRGAATRLLLGVVAMVCVVSALTYGNQRFRAAAEPAVVALAAVTVVALVDGRRRRAGVATVAAPPDDPR
jgi:4-amino-4-deoxy-L-arabinose transferase-like glycosyltransferase